MPARGNPVYAPARSVALPVPPHVRIIPVAHEERSVRRRRHVDRTEPAIVPGFQDRRQLPAETGALFRGPGRPHHPRPGVAGNHLIPEHLREQPAFVNRYAGGRPRPGLQEIGDHSRIVLVPVPRRNFRMLPRALRAPARPRHLIAVAVVAPFYYIVNAATVETVIVVVRLPDISKRIHRQLVVVAEIVPQHVQPSSIAIAAERHAPGVGEPQRVP